MLEKARDEYKISPLSLPRLTKSNEFLEKIERVMAVYDLTLLSNHGFAVGSFAELAREIYTEEESVGPEKALRSLVRDHLSKIMTYEYAWALQEQGLKRQGS